MNKFYALALLSNKLENKVVNDYGDVPPIEQFLEWNVEQEHYVFKDAFSLAQLEQYIIDFDKAWERAD